MQTIQVVTRNGCSYCEAAKKLLRTREMDKESEYPPTFHELLSLGEYLRKEQGWTVKQIQILRGHSSEKMTQKYLDGQEWTTVEMRTNQ